MKKMAALLLCVIVAMPVVISAYSFNPENFKDIRSKLMKRVIVDTITEKDIDFFKTKGCLIRHRLKDATSLDCPEDIISQLNVRQSRIFYIVDLDADKQIGADKVWAEGITGSGVNVAVLDTGIDTDHPELSDSYLGGYDYVNNDPNPEDDHGHGTHVSGIITSNGGNNANSKGVAPSAGIYMYKVCNANGECYEDDMVAAMEAAVGTDAKVMSISIGGGSFTGENCDSDPLAAKVNWVVSQGLTVVVAAGNDGRGVSSPGCASGAIGVGAVDSNNNVVYFSGRGKALDIVAPGVSIYSTLIGGYGTMSGTSMATPHVAGVVTLLLDANSGLTTSEIKNALYDSADPVNRCYECRFVWGGYCYGQGEVTCTPEITGAGVVDAYGAYLYVGSTPTTTTTTTTTTTSITTTTFNVTTTTITTTTTTVPTTTTTVPTTTTTIPTTTTTVPTTTTTTTTSTTTTLPPTTTTSSTTTTTLPTGKCWSGSNQYLYRNYNQLRKFCKCAEGNYGYNSYSFSFGRRTVYYYVDSGNNEKWDVTSRASYLPVRQVVCTDGKTYSTNIDYYYS